MCMYVHTTVSTSVTLIASVAHKIQMVSCHTGCSGKMLVMMSHGVKLLIMSSWLPQEMVLCFCGIRFNPRSGLSNFYAWLLRKCISFPGMFASGSFCRGVQRPVGPVPTARSCDFSIVGPHCPTGTLIITLQLEICKYLLQWDVPQQCCVSVLTGHSEIVYRACWSPSLPSTVASVSRT